MDRPRAPHATADTAVGAGLDRREFLALAGASMALASGLAGCVRKPPREVISWEHAPEYRAPGRALHFATTWMDGSFPYGLLVTSSDGRPIKVDGNPAHPIGGGASTMGMQAALLGLYDPGRLAAPLGAPDWRAADERVRQALRAARKVVAMTRATLGESEQALLRQFVERFPAARHVVFDPAGDLHRRRTWRRLYGAPGEWLPRFDRASVILSLGSDFLGTDGPTLEATARFAATRGPDDQAPASEARMSRLWVVESAVTLTGTNADHRLPLAPSRVASLAALLERGLSGAIVEGEARQLGLDARLVAALIADLRAAGERALVVAGPHLPDAVHAAVALLNHRLGAAGHTLTWNPQPALLEPTDPDDLLAAVQPAPDLLLCLGVDPVADWPGGGFDQVLNATGLSIAHAVFPNDTTRAATLALPSHHGLESWNDAAPRFGLRSLCQPLLRPLLDSRQEAGSLLAWMEPSPHDAVPGDDLRVYDYVRGRWQREILQREADPAQAFTLALQRGVHGAPQEAPPPGLDAEAARRLAASSQPADGVEVVFLPDNRVADGRDAPLAWLLEVPDPVTHQMWGNAAILGRRLADSLGLRQGDLLRLRHGERSVELPAAILPGTADGTVTLTLGMGRTHPVLPDRRVGVSVAALLPRDGRVLAGVRLEKAPGNQALIFSQPTFSMQGRPLALDGTLTEYRADPRFVAGLRHLPPKGTSLFPPVDYSKAPQWGMAIDLSRCTGCAACVVACQAENNVAVVGAEACANGREMHWIRVDQYRSGDPDAPTFHHQPLPCQQCETAPCESVCPVGATSHNHEGLNDMVYNRCVGTRYCSNNCPYKVRRFNFFNWQKRWQRDATQRLMPNPNVTVRQVGVMEKCTFCVQRINAARFRAAGEKRPIDEREVQTACQQACPANAIAFGSLVSAAGQPETQVARWHRSPRRYGLLEDLDTRPRVAYLARVRNPVDDGATGGSARHPGSPT